MPEKNSPVKSISCPECGSKISPELVELIMKGNNAYCENCGFPFTGIDPKRGEVKPLNKANYNKKDSKGNKKLSKEEEQWIAWKIEWNKWKNIIKDEINIQKKKWKTKKQQEKQRYREIKKEMRQKTKNYQPVQHNIPKPKRNFETIDSIQSKPYKQVQKHSIQMEKSPRSIDEIEHGFNTALDVLIQLAPFYYIFIFIMTIVSMFNGTSTAIMYALGSIVIEGFVIRYDLKSIIPSEKENRVDHAGIPLIIVGVFTLHSFGIGVFLLARGILHLIKFIQITKHRNPLHPAVVENEFCSALWNREVAQSIILVLKPLTLVYFFSSLLTQIGNTINNRDDSLGFLLYVVFSGLIIIGILFTKILPLFHRNDIEDFPEDKAIILIIIGVLSLSYGMGILFLILGILFIELRNKVRKLEKPLPKEIDVQKLHFHLVAKGKKQPVYRNSQDVYSENTKKIRRFDPDTGKPLNLEIPNQDTIQKSHYESPKENYSQFEDKRIFTVLEPEVRRRLLALQIDEDEKNEVAKSFIYLTLEKQLKYLDELERVNNDLNEKDLIMIRRIYSLPISEKQHKFLAKQLEFLPEKSQEEFVSFLEQTVKKE